MLSAQVFMEYLYLYLYDVKVLLLYEYVYTPGAVYMMLASLFDSCLPPMIGYTTACTQQRFERGEGGGV